MLLSSNRSRQIYSHELSALNYAKTVCSLINRQTSTTAPLNHQDRPYSGCVLTACLVVVRRGCFREAKPIFHINVAARDQSTASYEKNAALYAEPLFDFAILRTSKQISPQDSLPLIDVVLDPLI